MRGTQAEGRPPLPSKGRLIAGSTAERVLAVAAYIPAKSSTSLPWITALVNTSTSTLMPSVASPTSLEILSTMSSSVSTCWTERSPFICERRGLRVSDQRQGPTEDSERKGRGTVRGGRVHAHAHAQIDHSP